MFSALRDRLGFSRLKSAATGGAALGPDTFRFFLAMGVPLKQLYGQTEAAGAYTLQVHPRGRLRQLRACRSTTPRSACVDPDENGVGEIATRHPGLFKGYFGNEAATRETLAEDGWLRTGDAGFLDDKGRLTVIDRVKDIARTSTGIRFSPQFIENKLKFSPFVGECVVLGNGRPFLAAILCIRYSMVAKWAEGRRIGFTTYQNLAAHPQVGELLAGEVEQGQRQPARSAADPALSPALQGARPRRRRADPDPQGAPQRGRRALCRPDRGDLRAASRRSMSRPR